MVCQSREGAHNVVSIEGSVAGSQIVQNATQAKEICSVIDILSAGLFWGHEGWGTDEGTCPSKAHFFCQCVRESKIDDLDPQARGLDPQILRLDVSMD